MRRLYDISVSVATVLHFERLIKEHVDRPYVKYFLCKTMQLMNIKLPKSYTIWERTIWVLRGRAVILFKKIQNFTGPWESSTLNHYFKKKQNTILVPMYFCLHEMFIVSYSFTNLNS